MRLIFDSIDDEPIKAMCRAWGFPIEYEMRPLGDGKEFASLLNTYHSLGDSIYLSAFFYLTKRFGPPEIYDSYKDAGNWNFNVKNYYIRIRLDSCGIVVLIYGKGKVTERFRLKTPYMIMYQRRRRKFKDILLDQNRFFVKSKHYDPKHQEKIIDCLNKFIEKHNIDEAYCQQHFGKPNDNECLYEINEMYEKELFKIDSIEEIEQKYGYNYSNSRTRHAVNVLEKFLRSMLQPIWIRDVAYNIKGRLPDREISKLPISYIEYEYIEKDEL